MTRQSYPTDLTEAQWARIAPLLPPALPGGRPRSVDLREVLNAILYLTRAGCSWRLLPHDLPPWGTVHYYYRRWRLDGTWPQIHDTLREQVRVSVGREASPSAAILDSPELGVSVGTHSVPFRQILRGVFGSGDHGVARFFTTLDTDRLHENRRIRHPSWLVHFTGQQPRWRGTLSGTEASMTAFQSPLLPPNGP